MLSLHELFKLTTVLVTHDIEEAVYLADRIIILSGAPATVRKDIAIHINRPRRRTDYEFDQVRLSVLRNVINLIPSDAPSV